MASLNMVQLIGRLGKDPEIRFSQSGQTIANMSLATDESYTDRNGNKVERAEWHRLVAFGRQAELAQQYLCKGSQIYVQGALQTRKWQDQQGNDKYTTEVKLQRLQFLDRKGDNGQQNGNGQGQNGQTQGSETSYDMDDVPF